MDRNIIQKFGFIGYFVLRILRKEKRNLEISNNSANITAYVVQGEAVSHYQGMLGLKAEGKIITLPARYLPKIPSIIDPFSGARFIQRVKNHMMGVVTDKFKEYNRSK